MDDDDDDLEDYSEEDDSQETSKKRNGKRYHHESGEGGLLRGSSRTNCKGHWSKEEVSIKATISLTSLMTVI
jgi:hypothetical protein